MTVTRSRLPQVLSVALSYVAPGSIPSNGWPILLYFRAFLVDDDEFAIDVLQASAGTLAKRLFLGKAKVERALAQLAELGIVVEEDGGGRNRAAVWRVNTNFAEWRVRWSPGRRLALAELTRLTFFSPVDQSMVGFFALRPRSGTGQPGAPGAEVHAWKLTLRGDELTGPKGENQPTPLRIVRDRRVATGQSRGPKSPPRGGPSSSSISREREGGISAPAGDNPAGLRVLHAITEVTHGQELFDTRAQRPRSEIMAAACDSPDVEYVVEELHRLHGLRGGALGWRSALGLAVRLLHQGQPPEPVRALPVDNRELWLYDRVAILEAELERMRASGYDEELLVDEITELEDLRSQLAGCDNGRARKGELA